MPISAWPSCRHASWGDFGSNGECGGIPIALADLHRADAVSLTRDENVLHAALQRGIGGCELERPARGCSGELCGEVPRERTTIAGECRAQALDKGHCLREITQRY